MKTEIITDISKKDWDTFIARYGQWNFFQNYLWGELQISLSHKLWRFGVIENGTLVGVAQVIKVHAKRGTFLHLRHGPVFTTAASKTSLHRYWELLLQELRELAKKEKAWFIRTSPMIEDSVENRTLLCTFGFVPSPIHAMDAEFCWVLDLSPSEEELLRNMRKTTRYLIRNAEKMGVVIKENTDTSEFLKLYSITTKRHQFVPHRGIVQEFALFSKEDQAVLLLGTHNKELLAGAIIEFFGDQAIYHHGASIPTKIPATYLLQWCAIQLAKKRGMKLYNFWGIAPADNPRHPWRGITLFKQGFGGREVRFIHAHDLPLSPLYALSYSVEYIRRIKRGY